MRKSRKHQNRLPICAKTNKVRWMSAADAVGGAARAMRKSVSGTLRPYQCPDCHGWHLTSDKRAARQKIEATLYPIKD